MVEVTLEIIYEELQIIKEDIRQMKNKMDRLDHHINFVENTYEKFEQPLNYVCDRVNRMVSYTSSLLPVRASISDNTCP